MRMRVLFLLLVTFFSLSACNKRDDKNKIKGQTFDNSQPGKEGMKNAVIGYCQAVMDAYLSDRHIKFIKKYATDLETKRTFVFINTDREKGQAMAMKLNKIVFENISTSEKLSFADSSESWDYHYLDIKTSRPIEPVKEMRYKLRYTLVKENGNWKVSKLEQKENPVIGEYNPPRWSLTGK